MKPRLNRVMAISVAADASKVGLPALRFAAGPSASHLPDRRRWQ